MPDDYDPAEEEASPEEGSSDGDVRLSPEEDEEQDSSRGGRRRRRRRRSKAGGDRGGRKPSSKTSSSKKGDSDGDGGRGRRKQSRGGDEGEKDDGGSDDDGRRRRRRRRRSSGRDDGGRKEAGGKRQARAQKDDEKKPRRKERQEPKRKRETKDKRDAKSDSTRREDLTFDHSADEVEELSREIVLSESDGSQSVNDERKIAMFCDLENIALGVRDSSEVNKFDILLVLERLLEKGKIIVKKAYCDWERYSEYKRGFHEAAIEMIDIPQKYYSGKNSADIKMVVDAMDLSYSKEHLDTFVMLSGDSDFSPLVSKLKENNKYVIGIGVKNSSSNLLVDNCDEFIYYEDIWRDTQKAPKLDSVDSKSSKAFQLMVDAIQALVRENKDVLWGSMIKQTMQRKKPSFNESYYGYSSFSELLEDAEKKNIVKLKKDKRSGSYIVTGFA